MKINTTKTSKVSQDTKVTAFLEIDENASTYNVLRDKIQTLGIEKDVLRDKIVGQVDAIGNRDEKGNLVVVTSKFVVCNQNRTSTSFDEEKTKAFLKAKKLYGQCVKMEEVLDEDAVTRLVERGVITAGELKTITISKSSTALVVKEAK